MKNVFYFMLVAAALGINNARAADCLRDPSEYAAKLEKCEKFSCVFTHPFTNTKMTKQIVGLENGKCKTTEEMPNKGMMTCRFDEKQRKAVATQLKQSAKSDEAVGFKAEVDFATGKSKSSVYKNGKEIKDPLNEAMQDGSCVVSGY